MFYNLVVHTRDIPKISTIFGIAWELVNLLLTDLFLTVFKNITLGQVLHGIAIISVVSYMLQNELRNRALPNIKIKPLVLNQIALLEVHNIGKTTDKFMVTAKVVRGEDYFLDNLFLLEWEQGENSIEIHKNGKKRIKVAHQIRLGPSARIVGLEIPTIKNGELKKTNMAIWNIDERTGKMNLNICPKDIDLEISITSNKLKKSFSNMIFRLSQESPKKLKFEYVECKDRKLRLDKYGYLG